MKGINLKFGNMRKEQRFVIYPVKKGDETLLLQSDKTIIQLNTKTGESIYNSRSGGAYFIHLNLPDRKQHTFSQADLFKIKAMAFGEGDTLVIGAGITADNSGAKNIFEM